MLNCRTRYYYSGIYARKTSEECSRPKMGVNHVSRGWSLQRKNALFIVLYFLIVFLLYFERWKLHSLMLQEMVTLIL